MDQNLRNLRPCHEHNRVDWICTGCRCWCDECRCFSKRFASNLPQMCSKAYFMLSIERLAHHDFKLSLTESQSETNGLLSNSVFVRWTQQRMQKVMINCLTFFLELCINAPNESVSNNRFRQKAKQQEHTLVLVNVTRCNNRLSVWRGPESRLLRSPAWTWMNTENTERRKRRKDSSAHRTLADRTRRRTAMCQRPWYIEMQTI